MAIDVTPWIAAFERELRAGGSPLRSAYLRTVLERWQWDEMLDDQSRTQARRVLHGLRAQE